MKKLIFLLAVLFLLVPLASHAQTHQFCPTDATCTWTGPQTFNGPVSIPGNVSVGGTLGAATCTAIDGVVCADGQSGSDYGTKINAAFAACATTPCTVFVGVPGTHVYSTDIFFSSPATLECADGVFLSYSGSGNAVKLGSDGLVIGTAQLNPYLVKGCGFTGGASMAQGIYCNTFVTDCGAENNYFLNFGNSSGYAFFGQAQNWHVLLRGNRFVDTDTTARNKVRIRGKSVAAVSDNGNSQLFFTANLMTAPNMLGGANPTGIGVWTSGTGSQITNNKIEGYAPNVRVASTSTRVTVSNNYFEDVNNTCNVEFGDPVGGDAPGNFIASLVIEQNYANMHNTDSFGTTANFICPTSGNTLTGLQNAQIRDNTLANIGATIPMVGLNNVASQTNNESSGNTGQALEHTTGASITAWRSFINGQYANGVDDSSNGNYLDLKEGVTANNSKGIAARGFNNALQGLCDWDLNGVFRCLAGTGLNNVIRGDTSGNVTISKAGQTTTFPGPIVIANTLVSPTAPTIAAGGCGGAAATIATNNGTAAFSVNVGTTPTTACTITMPTAANGWNCYSTDITTNSTTVFLQKQTATGASSVTITNFNDVAVAANLTASDILQVSCFAR